MSRTHTTRLSLKAMLFLALFILPMDAAASRRYVDVDATGGNSGINWVDAFPDLQTALLVALPGDEIWVAEGTYYPTSVNDRDAYFDMKAQVSLYGGFNATETMLSERDWVAHPTILSGEIGTSADSDNSFHVVRAWWLNDTFVLDGFVVKGGYANQANPDDRGAGLRIHHSPATIRNVTFVDNFANSWGAGANVSNDFETFLVTFDGTTFKGNQVGFRGGGAIVSGGVVEFVSCAVDSNLAGNDGAGLRVNHDQTIVTITNSTFSGNVSVVDGSAIAGVADGNSSIDNSVFIGNNNTAVVTNAAVSNCQFINNSGVIGGAIQSSGTIDHCTFQGNTATDGGAVWAMSGPVSNSTFVSNTALDEGGAIYTTGHQDFATLVIAQCDFDSNMAQSGGAIFSDSETLKPVEIKNSNMTANTATFRGGGVFSFDRSTSLLNTDFTGNSAPVGGAIAGWFVVSGGLFKSNTADTGGAIQIEGGTCGGATFRGNSASLVGGAVALEPSTACTVTTCDVDSNSAPDGGGIHIIQLSTEFVRIVDTQVQNNSASRGGGIFTSGVGIGIEVDRCHLHDNDATATGGGLYNASTITFSNSVLHDNTADGGGGIADLATASFYTNLTLSQNSAQNGGGFWNVNGTPEIRNCILWNDTAPIGPEINNTGASAIIGNSIVEGSGGSGGGWDPSVGSDDGGNIDADPLFNNPPADFDTGPGSPVIEGGDIAAVGYGLLDFGGGQRVRGFVVDIGAYESGFFCPPGSRLYVDLNAGGSESGVDWPNAYLEFRDALTMAAQCPTITEIWIAQGTYYPTDQSDSFASFVVRSGLSLYGGFAGTESTLAQRDLATSSTILSGEIGSPVPTNNSYHVVVVDSTDSTTLIDGFTITGGYADGAAAVDRLGAGIRAREASPTVRNVTFANNFSEDGGAGYYGTNGNVVMANVVVIDNAANAPGAGLFITGSGLSVTNGSFTRNSGTLSSALYATSSSVTITNCIFWGDTASVLYPEFVLGASGTVSSSIVAGSGGSGIGWNPAIATDGGNNLDLDPLYVDAAGQNLRLQSPSPAIDAGDGGAPSLPSVDRDNLPRVSGAAVDMGAYEFVTATAVGDDPSGTATPSLSRIESAAPNPFNPTLTVVLAVAEAGPVEVSVYDVRGARVRRIWTGPRQAGRFTLTWDARRDDGASAASGVYFIRLETVGAVSNRKVVLLK